MEGTSATSVGASNLKAHIAPACGTTGMTKNEGLYAKVVRGLRALRSIAGHVGFAETKSVTRLRKGVDAQMTSSHSMRRSCREPWKKFWNIYAETADTSRVFEKTPKESGVAKKCQRKLKRGFQLLLETNTSAECARV